MGPMSGVLGQALCIGKQTGGRIFLFLYKEESYGLVAVGTCNPQFMASFPGCSNPETR
jgi:hypothetical protein